MRCHASPAVSLVVLAALACGGATERATEHLTGAPARRIEAVSPSAIEARFGDETRIAVRVTNPDGLPLSNVGVVFWPSDGGRVDPTAGETDANGLASTVWTVSEYADRQSLKAQLTDDRFVEFTVAVRNGWTLVPPAGPSVTTRAADESPTSPWASTALRGTPLLSVTCEPFSSTAPNAGDGSLGVVALRVTVPAEATLEPAVTWTLDGREPVTERWDVRSGGAALEYPSSNRNTEALVGWIETAKKFTIQFTEATTNGRYTATFGGAGLRIVAPSVTAPCHPATNNPWDY